MEKKNIHSNKDFGYRASKDAIFTKHLTDLSDQTNVLQKALANSPGDNLPKIATVPNELDKKLQNFKDHSLQCKRCGRKWIYHGRNPYRARRTYCGTTVIGESPRLDT